ncbi:MAG: hypothetical protein U9M95_02070 [Candidatus Altiarchaeota archaeon]|nr:hypothetical protein [Candidatus Altiarchaeota archaeon]
MKKIMFLFVVLLCSGLVSSQPTCVGEGGFYAVVPGHLDCCPGLTPISCDSPDVEGICHGDCVGAQFCTYCGDGVCGLGENKCNCPQDCLGTPAPEFASLTLLLAALLTAPMVAYLIYKNKH